MEFSIEEIRKQLEQMGYRDVPPNILQQFKEDLNQTRVEDFTFEGRESPRGHESRYYDSRESPIESNRPSEEVQGGTASVHKQNVTNHLSREVVHTSRAGMRRKVAPRRVLSETSPREDWESEDDLQSPHLDYDAIRPVLKKQPHHPHERQWKTSQPVVQVERHFDPTTRRARFADNPVDHIKNFTSENVKLKSIDFSTKDCLGGESSSFKGKQKPLKKTDPVQRYHNYQRIWNVQSEPGRDGHKKLRWAVKAAMLVHEVPIPAPRAKSVTDPYLINRSESESRKNNWDSQQRFKPFEHIY